MTQSTASFIDQLEAAALGKKIPMPNPVAKHAPKFNKPATHKDKKKASKKGEVKHKKDIYDEVEPTAYTGSVEGALNDLSTLFENAFNVTLEEPETQLEPISASVDEMIPFIEPDILSEEIKPTISPEAVENATSELMDLFEIMAGVDLTTGEKIEEPVTEEVIEIPSEGPVIVATGPLTSPKLSKSISRLIGQEYLYFYDAISPIVDANTIDYKKTFFASRYDKGSDDYLNCPLNESQYYSLVNELKNGEKVPLKSFEKPIYFEGCMPVEELAMRGDKTLAFGPLKPVGLLHPETKEKFYAVVQLRHENKEGTAFNLVGFQTKLTYPEQKRVIRMIPGLENAELFRYGAIHRNTYINAHDVLSCELNLKKNSGIYF